MQTRYNRANPKYKFGQVLVSKKYPNFTIKLVEKCKKNHGKWRVEILSNPPAWLKNTPETYYAPCTISAGFEISEMGTVLYG